MSCIFIKIQACENERISGSIKILNTINRKKRLKKCIFLPKDTKKKVKKSFNDIYFCSEKNMKKNDHLLNFK